MSVPMSKLDDQRREMRQRYNAIVQLDPCYGGKPISCLVWDISLAGARLKLSVPIALRKVVFVHIGNVRKGAAVAWRKGDQIGLEFIP